MEKVQGQVIGTIAIIAVVLCIAWFQSGGEHFKSVALICYGFFIGWLNGFVVARSVYTKK
jgi:hypothetical protein